MKVYQVCKGYFDGDHDHGSYKSPIFATRELAEQFLAQVWGKDLPECKEWWSEFDDDQGDGAAPSICEMDVLEEPVTDVLNAHNYQNITFT